MTNDITIFKSPASQTMIDIYHQSQKSWPEFINSTSLSHLQKNNIEIFTSFQSYQSQFTSTIHAPISQLLNSKSILFKHDANDIVVTLSQIYNALKTRKIPENTCLQIDTQLNLQLNDSTINNYDDYDDSDDDDDGDELYEQQIQNYTIQQQIQKTNNHNNKKEKSTDDGQELAEITNIIRDLLVQLPTNPYSYKQYEMLLDLEEQKIKTSLKKNNIPNCEYLNSPLCRIFNSIKSMDLTNNNTLMFSFHAMSDCVRIYSYLHFNGKIYGSRIFEKDLLTYGMIPSLFEDNKIEPFNEQEIRKNMEGKCDEIFEKYKTILFKRNISDLETINEENIQNETIIDIIEEQNINNSEQIQSEEIANLKIKLVEFRDIIHQQQQKIIILEQNNAQKDEEIVRLKHIHVPMAVRQMSSSTDSTDAQSRGIQSDWSVDDLKDEIKQCFERSIHQVPLTPLFPTPPQNGYNNDHLPPSFPPNTMSTTAHGHGHGHVNHGHNHHPHTHNHPHQSHPHSHNQNIQYLRSNSGDTDPTQCPHGNLTAEELINIKIRKRNVCYVVGLPIHVATETKLRTQEWFGQFGNIATIAINRNSKSIQANSIPAHITYDNDISALNAINFCNKFIFDDGRKLKATFGTQHYCRWFIAANKKCTNVFCGFRHSWCKPSDIITQKDINDFKAIPAGAYTSRNIENQPLGVRSVSHNTSSHTPNSATHMSSHTPNSATHYNNNPNTHTHSHTVTHQANILDDNDKYLRIGHSLTPSLDTLNKLNNNNNPNNPNNNNNKLLNNNDNISKTAPVDPIKISADPYTFYLSNSAATPTGPGQPQIATVPPPTIPSIPNIYDSRNVLMKQIMNRNQNLQIENDRLTQQIKILSEMEIKNKQEIHRWWTELAQSQQNEKNLKQKYDKICSDFKNLELKHDDLQIKYLALDERYKHLLNCKNAAKKKEFESWNSQNVCKWIMNLDNKKYKKYENDLCQNINTENIDGQCLESLDKGDLHRLGVTDFKAYASRNIENQPLGVRSVSHNTASHTPNSATHYNNNTNTHTHSHTSHTVTHQANILDDNEKYLRIGHSLTPSLDTLNKINNNNPNNPNNNNQNKLLNNNDNISKTAPVDPIKISADQCDVEKIMRQLYLNY